MRTFLSILLCSVFAVSTASAQTGISVEPAAGLSFFTKDNFKDFYETGLMLGGRASYAVTENISATVGMSYHRYSSKDRLSVDLAKGNGLEGLNPDVTFTIFGFKAGAQYGGAATETLGYFAGAELGPVNQKTDNSSQSEWDLAFGLYAGGRYHFTPETAVGFGPVFNVVTSEGEAYHFLDFVVSVLFSL